MDIKILPFVWKVKSEMAFIFKSFPSIMKSGNTKEQSCDGEEWLSHWIGGRGGTAILCLPCARVHGMQSVVRYPGGLLKKIVELSRSFRTRWKI